MDEKNEIKVFVFAKAARTARRRGSVGIAGLVQEMGGNVRGWRYAWAQTHGFTRGHKHIQVQENTHISSLVLINEGFFPALGLLFPPPSFISFFLYSFPKLGG